MAKSWVMASCFAAGLMASACGGAAIPSGEACAALTAEAFEQATLGQSPSSASSVNALSVRRFGSGGVSETQTPNSTIYESERAITVKVRYGEATNYYALEPGRSEIHVRGDEVVCVIPD